MSGVLMPLIADEETQSPVAMENAPVTVSPRRRASIRQRVWNEVAIMIIVSLVGSLAVVSAVWQIGQASRARLILPAQGVWTKAWITTIGSRSMTLDTGNGSAWELGLDFNDTSVFQDGGVLNITHLRQGQQVTVLSSRSHGMMMAKAIEIGPLSDMSAIRAWVAERHVM